MAILESINNATNKAVKLGEDYVKSSQEYYTLKIFQQLSYSFSTLYKIIIIGCFLLLGIIFVTISGALYLGEYLNSMPLGCLIVGGILFVVAGIVYLLRKYIDKSVINKVGEKLFNQNHEQNHETV